MKASAGMDFLTEGQQQFRKQTKQEKDTLDDNDDFDDFETVAEKKKVIRPPVQKPQGPAIIPPAKMPRKVSDAD